MIAPLSGSDALADDLGCEGDLVVEGQLEIAVAHVAGHRLVAVVFRFDMDDRGAVWALAFVLMLEVRVVELRFGKLG
ncbi:hypothetical protein D3C77_547160 [compost metagenome]